MFSGIIDAIGTIREVRSSAGGRVLRVDAPIYWGDVLSGASIAVDGVCLTLMNQQRDTGDFDVIAETLRRTTLGDLKAGDRVNLQKSLAVGDRVDGHFVQGHVDAVGRVSRVEESERESIWWIQIDAETMAYVTPKGAIAVDGVSLTIASMRDTEFSVALIPTTLQRTTLASKRPGARVNVETDILARTLIEYLRRMTSSPDGPLGGETLQRQGLP